MSIVLILPLATVQAGVFSAMQRAFTDTSSTFSSERTVRIENSQNAQLLKAAANADPTPPPAGGGNIAILNGTALLPGIGPAAGATGGEEKEDIAKREQISAYVVREGDSLSQIAEMFDVSMNTIRWANDIGSHGMIQPGQTLVILPVNGVRYTVEEGDTLSKIADRFSGKVEDIRNFNDLAADASLAAGEKIIVPHGEMPQKTQQDTQSGGQYAARTQQVPSYSGYYGRPVPAGVKTQGRHGYNAVDFGASYGTQVLASAPGRVVVSRYRPGNPWFGGYGNYVVIEHENGTQTLYAHLSKNTVKRGWKVVKGQVIGYVGSTGRSTGPHVHFEVRGAQNPF